MEKRIPELTSRIRKSDNGHIFYLTEKTSSYIENILVFIVDGVKNQEHVLIVENKRLTPMIQNRLQNELTKEELMRVHFFDNFEFYWQKGNFLPNTITEHFKEKYDSLLPKDQQFRTWGHIEWSSQDSLEEELLAYEKKVDLLITENKLIAVCAYDAPRVKADLQEQLGAYHHYLMKDNQIITLL